MLLKEFFGRAIAAGKELAQNEKDKDKENLDLFYYILDHDKLHKDYFFPIAKKIKETHHKKNINKEEYVKKFMPMVNKGCMEYYKHKNLNGKIGKLFPKSLREELCEKLFDHYFEDVLKDRYQIGM